MPLISRRVFLESASAIAAISTVTTRAHSSALASDADMSFFDERFAQARQVALQLAWSEPTPVQADVTPIWNMTRKRITQSPTATLRGITTESFHFCLTTLLREHAGIATNIERVHRDLYLWSIGTTIPDTATARLMEFSDG